MKKKANLETDQESVSPPKKRKTGKKTPIEENSEEQSSSPPKKRKNAKKTPLEEPTPPPKKLKTIKKTQFENNVVDPDPKMKITRKPTKRNPLEKKSAGNNKNPQWANGKLPEKIEDWMEFKKQKRELRVKRKQARAKDGYGVIVKAKAIGEELRRKTLNGGQERRVQLITDLHSLLKGKHYVKFVLGHDTARIVQWLLKYASETVRQQIAEEVVPAALDMMQSKYAIFCVNRLLKYGNANVRSKIIGAMLGNVVKLATHSLSSPVLEYAYSTWASTTQKQYFLQEFFGDLYKNSKDPDVKHLRDTYKNNHTLKAATLGATKANLVRVLNKSLLDSGLVQTVLKQFLEECSEDDKKELISQLVSHIVVISNSRDGAKVAMQCIWNGSNKDRKTIMKTLKEHLVEVSKHEHGHTVIIALLDSVDDTVLLNKIILTDLLKSAKDLAIDEWGRKVLLWLVAPMDQKVFHPQFLRDLNQGRESSNCKKSPEIRRKEILDYAIGSLLNLIIDDARFWLKNASLATEMAAILKAGSDDALGKAYDSVIDVITDLEWKLEENDKEILGIEHSGMSMVFKKLAQHDKTRTGKNIQSFGEALHSRLTDDLLKVWLKLNRGCLLLVFIFENGSEEVQNSLKDKLRGHLKMLKKQDTTGAKILLNKLV